jgi:hypothetical protein
MEYFLELVEDKPKWRIVDLNKGKSDSNNITKIKNIDHAPHQATKKENTQIWSEKGVTREKRKQKQDKKERKIGQ